MRGRIYTLDPPTWTMPVARSFKVFRTPRRKMFLLIRGIRLHLARTELTAWVLRAQVNLIFNNWSCIYGTNDNYICLSLFEIDLEWDAGACKLETNYAFQRFHMCMQVLKFKTHEKKLHPIYWFVNLHAAWTFDDEWSKWEMDGPRKSRKQIQIGKLAVAHLRLAPFPSTLSAPSRPRSLHHMVFNMMDLCGYIAR